MIKSAILFGLVLLFAGTTQKALAQDGDVSLQSFYDELSPYGTWIQDPQYGYVWRPDVDQEEFRPYYTNGRWVMTEYGNTWVSNYDWGWAPFHYGRWVYNRYNQWIWLPDTVWGPAWVSWRSGGGYYGWAPLGPSISIGINIGRGGYRVPDMCWNFVPYANIYYNNYPRYSWNRNRVYIQNTVIINNTYVRNNRTYYTGPRIDDIRRETNQRVNVYAINRSHSPVSRIENNRVSFYQPRPNRDGRNDNPAPRNAIQGNINRGQVGRENNGNVSRGDNDGQYQRNGNGSYQSNRGERNDAGNRNGGYNRSQRVENGNPGTNNQTGRENNGRVGQAPPSNDGVVNQRPSVFGRNRDNNTNPSSQNADRGAQNQQNQERLDRSREMAQQQAQQRAERSREQGQQMQQQQQQEAQQRMERSRAQQMQQQRAERPQQQSAPRSERVQQQPQERNSGNENRGGGGGREGAGGRPGRG